MHNINAQTTIEELIRIKPESVGFLLKKGIQCIACGEPVWGTILELFREKNLSDEEIEEYIRALNDL